MEMEKIKSGIIFLLFLSYNELWISLSMSQPNTTTTKKRCPSSSSSTTSTTSTTTPGGHSPAMKKAKSQAIAFSTDKNGLQHRSQQQSSPLHFDPDMDTIEDPNPNDVSRSSSAVTSNLSRKKATPPQPAKKLVIKLLKGNGFISIFTSKFCSFFQYNNCNCWFRSFIYGPC